MNLVITLIVGGFVGWVASIVAKTNTQMGLVANIIVGVVGSLIGHRLAALLGFVAFGSVAQLTVSVLGAVILIAVLRALKVYR
jgi:uncharacterized membrane protein YeaQ/YmgE (transglycosylase-associated protein family)